MKKINTMNFLKEDRKEEKYFLCILLILIFLLLFQGISDIKSIKTLEEEVNEMKISLTKKEIKKVKLEKSTLLQDTEAVYEILGTSNVDSLSISKNKVQLEGKCEDLGVLDKLKDVKNISNISINNVEKEGSNYLFKVVYQIGGAE